MITTYKRTFFRDLSAYRITLEKKCPANVLSDVDGAKMMNAAVKRRGKKASCKGCIHNTRNT